MLYHDTHAPNGACCKNTTANSDIHSGPNSAVINRQRRFPMLD